MSKSSGVVAPRSEAEAFFKANPDVDSIEMIYTDMGGVPRGKRLRQHVVMAVYESGRMFPGSITVVDITDVDFLRRYVSEHGKILPQRLSGLNAAQQRKVKRGVRRARTMGIMM